MFLDMADFSKALFIKFTKPTANEERRIWNMDLGESTEWEVDLETISEFDRVPDWRDCKKEEEK